MKKLMALCLLVIMVFCSGTALAKDSGKDRYVELFRENSFCYYMDKQSAKWIPCPGTNDEYIIDVWIKLVREESAEGEENSNAAYAYPDKYYMEHYYLRPSQEQIQFLCELEVSGRPDNNIKEREYASANWDKLVPESIEDSIYHSVIKNMKNLKRGKNKKLTEKLGDFVESTFWVAI